MNAPDAILQLFELVSACQVPRQWEGRHLRLKLKDNVSCHLLRDLERSGFVIQFEELELNALFANDKINTLSAGIGIELQTPQIASQLAVVRSLDDLIMLPGVQSGELAPCAICDEHEFLAFNPGEPAPTAELQHLAEVIDFWQLLKTMCDHELEDGGLLFLGVRRVEIANGFTRKDLMPSQIPEIIKFTRDLDREEVRKEIFKSMLMDILVEQRPENAFSYLLANLKLFARRLKEGLAIYLSDRSPAKLQREAEGKALSYTEKLDKLLSAMETKSFTIPAALLLAYKEVQPGAPTWSGANCVVLVTTSLYFLTMIWAYSTQKELINQLSAAVSTFRQDLQLKGLDAENPVLKSVCPSLERRISHAIIASRIMCACAAFPLLLAGLQTQTSVAKPSPEVGVLRGF